MPSETEIQKEIQHLLIIGEPAAAHMIEQLVSAIESYADSRTVME